MSVNEVRARLQLSLFGTKISLSVSPDEDQAARTEFAKSSEDAPVSNVDDPSFSPSSSGSDDEKTRLTTEKEPIAEVPIRQTEVSQNEHSEQTDTTTSKAQLKRPDKPVPCPRCNSLDTKFCYYNNYNVNQPRHFCKNCQRYWTAGGTLRNVPVGAGRRKNKAGRSDGVVPRGNSLQEGHKLRQSLYTGCKRALELPAKETPVVRQRKGGGACEETGSLQRSVSGGSDGSNDSMDDSTCGSSVSNPAVAQESKRCFQGIYAGCVNTTTTNNNTENGRGGLWHGFPWPVPAWCPTATWNTPWGNLAATAASAAAKVIANNVGSLQLRHLRDETTSNRGPLWAPKTLRIDAWAGNRSFLGDMGAGNKVGLSISTGGMFKAFQQENGTQTTTTTTTTATDSTIITTSEPEDAEEANKVDINRTVTA